MSQDFSVLLHTPTDGTDGDCTASLKNPRGIEPRRILPQPRGSQAHTCMSPQSSDCLTFIHNLKPSDPSIFFRTPHHVLRWTSIPIEIFCPLKSFLLLCTIDVSVLLLMYFAFTNLHAIALTSIFSPHSSRGKALAARGQTAPVERPVS